MLKSIVLAGVCSVSFLAAAPAFAQAGKPQFVTQQTTNEWRASKLVGVDVYGTDNKKIGSIDEVMLDPRGNAKVAVIGVGGFLGIDQKDVGVPFSSLKWRREAEGRTATNANGNATSPNVAAAQRGYPDHAVLSATKDELQNAPNFKFASDTSNTNTQSSTTSAPATTDGNAVTPGTPSPAPNH
jgi:sporulation protein YlmC with PRC-barrel domain